MTTIPERAKKIVDLVFNHAEEYKGLQRTVLERGVEDILLAAQAREPRPYIPHGMESVVRQCTLGEPPGMIAIAGNEYALIRRSERSNYKEVPHVRSHPKPDAVWRVIEDAIHRVGKKD
jgi:hypothetical protein